MPKFATSDLHFGHKKIKDFCPGRPGNTIQEMNEILIANWNARVGKKDTVYILGDFSFLGKEETTKIVKRLNGRKILNLGNHDRPAKWMLECGFDEIIENEYVFLHGKDGVKRKVFVSHYPYLPSLWEQIKFKVFGKKGDRRYMHKRIIDQGGWLLCGHTHSTEKLNGRMINVGVDANNFAPISEVEIIALMEKK